MKVFTPKLRGPQIDQYARDAFDDFGPVRLSCNSGGGVVALIKGVEG